MILSVRPPFSFVKQNHFNRDDPTNSGSWQKRRRFYDSLNRDTISEDDSQRKHESYDILSDKKALKSEEEEELEKGTEIACRKRGDRGRRTGSLSLVNPKRAQAGWRRRRRNEDRLFGRISDVSRPSTLFHQFVSDAVLSLKAAYPVCGLTDR